MIEIGERLSNRNIKREDLLSGVVPRRQHKRERKELC